MPVQTFSQLNVLAIRKEIIVCKSKETLIEAKSEKKVGTGQDRQPLKVYPWSFFLSCHKRSSFLRG
jgi:hypothetical protein